MDRPKRRSRPHPAIGWSIFLSSAIAAAVNALIPYLPRVYGFFVSFLSEFWANLIGLLIVISIGMGLYFIREKQRIFYGWLEIVFALISGWYGVSKMATAGFAEAISVVAAIYLMVRGIDNIMEGRKKQLETVIVNDNKQIQSETKNELSVKT